MRLLIYNIRSATGTGRTFHLPVPGAGYLGSSPQVLDRITGFIKAQDPDVVGLIEVDTGSIRTDMVNQARYIADRLGHYSTYQCKYGEASINRLVPIVRKQGNAFLASPRDHGERFHYFEQGIKRLIIELELEDVAIFLVHLSLKCRGLAIIGPDQRASRLESSKCDAKMMLRELGIPVPEFAIFD